MLRLCDTAAQIRSIAQDKLEQLQNDAALENKHVFIAQLQRLTDEYALANWMATVLHCTVFAHHYHLVHVRRLLGIPVKTAATTTASASEERTMHKTAALAMKPLPEELRQPSAQALESIRVRQTVRT